VFSLELRNEQPVWAFQRPNSASRLNGFSKTDTLRAFAKVSRCIDQQN
jgi:hypothetical protein